MPNRIKGYIHDPKEEGGPYIAVVLCPNNEPTITLHKSYAEAERELSHKVAEMKEIILSHRVRGEMPAGPKD